MEAEISKLEKECMD
jgi:hypothetical protein